MPKITIPRFIIFFLSEEYSRLVSRGGIEVIEHPVDNDACDRNIEPGWQCPAREPNMPGEPPSKAEISGNKRHGSYSSRQDRMRDQDRKVYTSRPALRRKSCRLSALDRKVVIEV